MRRAAKRFINHIKTERGLSRETVESYRDDLKKFIEFVETKKGRGLLPARSIFGSGEWGRTDIPVQSVEAGAISRRSESRWRWPCDSWREPMQPPRAPARA